MAIHRFLLSASVLSTWALFVPATPAQEAEVEKPASAEVALVPETPVEHLQILLRPYTLEELEAEALAWRDRLKTKATEIARHEVEVKQLAGGESKAETKQELLSKLNEMREQKAVLLQQFDAVVDAYEAKGGDVASLRKYAAALSGISLDATDAASFWTTLTGWLGSREGGMRWLIASAQFISVMLVAWFISRLLGNVVRRALAVKHVRISGLLRRFVNNMVRRVVLLIGLMIALATIGVNVGALVALIGGGAFVLGFALQDTLSNFANGIMLFIYRPFDVGDAVDINGVSGSVEAVSLVSTTIRSWDNKVILVPNR
jgi:small conductance mechanosensitive channel